jgi:hypothetical protein
VRPPSAETVRVSALLPSEKDECVPVGQLAVADHLGILGLDFLTRFAPAEERHGATHAPDRFELRKALRETAAH